MIKATEDLTREFILDTILEHNLGITDAREDEISALLALSDKDVKELDQYLADMVSLRAQLGVKKKI